MSRYYNPHQLRNGVFVQHNILSLRQISYGAKFLYRLLEDRVDYDSETLVPLSLLAKLLGTSQKKILEMGHELAGARLIEIRKEPADTQTLRCRFLRPTWLESLERLERSDVVLGDNKVPLTEGTRQQASSSQQSGQPRAGEIQVDGEARSQVGSRYELEVIQDYVRHRQELGQSIENSFGLTKYLLQTGKQDKEIGQFLATRCDKANAA